MIFFLGDVWLLDIIAAVVKWINANYCVYLKLNQMNIVTGLTCCQKRTSSTYIVKYYADSYIQ